MHPFSNKKSRLNQLSCFLSGACPVLLYDTTHLCYRAPFRSFYNQSPFSTFRCASWCAIGYGISIVTTGIIVLAIRQCAAWASTLITHKHQFPERRKPRKQRKGAWSPPSESTFGLNSYQVSTGLVVILVWYEVVRKCQVRCTWYVISMYHIPGTYRRVGWGAWQAPSSVQPIKDTVAVAKTSDSW